MYVKKIFLLLTWALAATVAWADAKIHFTTPTHDFGTIQESVGDVSYEFHFTNEGNAPLLVLRATASCGCTTPEYTKQPIRPGEKGIIKVTYHAKGRPGPFEKSIHIYDNTNKRTLLTITGNVISSRNPGDSFGIALGGGLRVKARSLNFFDVYPNKAARTRTLAVYNESDEPIQLTVRDLPKHIGVSVSPTTIKPKTEGKVMFTYDAGKVKDWGMRRDKVQIFVNGKESKMQNNSISLLADIWEDFSGMSRKEKEAAGEIEIDGTGLDFGRGEMAREMMVTIRNTGRQKLTIRKIQNDKPEMFECKLENPVIKPGEATTLIIVYHPEKCKQSNISHHITIISNDPSNSRVIINMSADK